MSPPPLEYITASLTFNCAFCSGCIHDSIWNEQADETSTVSELGGEENQIQFTVGRGWGGGLSITTYCFIEYLGASSRGSTCVMACVTLSPTVQSCDEEVLLTSSRLCYCGYKKSFFFQFLSDINSLYYSLSVFHTWSPLYCMRKYLKYGHWIHFIMSNIQWMMWKLAIVSIFFLCLIV